MRTLLIGLLIALVGSAAQAETTKLCSKGHRTAIMVERDACDQDVCSPQMTLIVGGVATGFNRLTAGTGLGYWLWIPVASDDDKDVATDDGNRLDWHGRSYRRCGT